MKKVYLLLAAVFAVAHTGNAMAGDGYSCSLDWDDPCENVYPEKSGNWYLSYLERDDTCNTGVAGKWFDADTGEKGEVVSVCFIGNSFTHFLNVPQGWVLHGVVTASNKCPKNTYLQSGANVIGLKRIKDSNCHEFQLYEKLYYWWYDHDKDGDGCPYFPGRRPVLSDSKPAGPYVKATDESEVDCPWWVKSPPKPPKVVTKAILLF